MSEYRWCSHRQQKIAEEVCDKNLASNRCHRLRNGECKMRLREVEMSDERRQELSERMKRINEKRRNKNVEREADTQNEARDAA